jgi:hypothetical protein
MLPAYPPAAMQAVIQSPGCGQLTIQVLTARNRGFLGRLQRAASAFPLSCNPDLRNDLCLDQTIRDGPFLASFLSAGGWGVETFAGTEGSLFDDRQLWKRVSNDAFFAAIRRAWTSTMHPTRSGPGLRHQLTPCAKTQTSTLLACSVWGSS